MLPDQLHQDIVGIEFCIPEIVDDRPFQSLPGDMGVYELVEVVIAEDPLYDKLRFLYHAAVKVFLAALIPGFLNSWIVCRVRAGQGFVKGFTGKDLLRLCPALPGFPKIPEFSPLQGIMPAHVLPLHLVIGGAFYLAAARDDKPLNSIDRLFFLAFLLLS